MSERCSVFRGVFCAACSSGEVAENVRVSAMAINANARIAVFMLSFSFGIWTCKSVILLPLDLLPGCGRLLLHLWRATPGFRSRRERHIFPTLPLRSL